MIDILMVVGVWSELLRRTLPKKYAYVPFILLGVGIALAYVIGPDVRFSNDAGLSIMMLGLCGIIFYGLLTFVLAPVWSVGMLSNFLLVMLYIVWVLVPAALPWQVFFSVGFLIILLGLFSTVRNNVFFRSFAYGFALVSTIVMGVLYVLQMISSAEEHVDTILFTSILLATVAVAGSFSLKYFTIWIATIVNMRKEAWKILSVHLDKWFLRVAPTWTNALIFGVIVGLLVLGHTEVIDPYTAVSLGLVAVYYDPNTSPVQK